MQVTGGHFAIGGPVRRIEITITGSTRISILLVTCYCFKSVHLALAVFSVGLLQNGCNTSIAVVANDISQCHIDTQWPSTEGFR